MRSMFGVRSVVVASVTRVAKSWVSGPNAAALLAGAPVKAAHGYGTELGVSGMWDPYAPRHGPFLIIHGPHYTQLVVYLTARVHTGSRG